MDDIKLFVKKLETLIQAVQIYSEDIRMEFSREKCALLIMKSGKRHMTEGMELPNQENIWTLGKTKLTSILEYESGHYQTREMKGKKNKKKTLGRTRKLLETKLHSWNLIKGINTWVVLFVRCSGLFLKWTREEIQQMDKTTRKLMTMHKALKKRLAE